MSNINFIKESIRTNLSYIQENWLDLEKNFKDVGTVNDTLEKRKTM